MSSPSRDILEMERPAGESLEKQRLPGMNGHTSPPASVAKPIDEDTALLNGHGSHEGTPGKDSGDTRDGSTAQLNTAAVTTNQAISTKADEPPASDPVPDRQNSASADLAPQSEKSPHISSPKPTSEASRSAAGSVHNDTEMVDTPLTQTPANETQQPQLESSLGPRDESAPAKSPTDKPETPKRSASPVAEQARKASSPLREDADVVLSDAKSEPETKEQPEPTPQDVDLQPASMSQLAIDGKEEASSPATNVLPLPDATDGDVTMTDAPASAPLSGADDLPVSSNKVPRERDEDAIEEEPSAKRAKTETRDEEETTESAAPIEPVVEVASSQQPGEAVSGDAVFDDVPGWLDPEVNARVITPFRVKGYRNALAGIKKTKNGAVFKDAVAKLWPALASGYLARVERPMDIGLMERNLRDRESYNTLGDLKKDLVLLYQNTLIFNGPGHDVTVAGQNVVPAIWGRLLDVPAEEPAKPKAPPKHNPTRHTEPRVPPPPPQPIAAPVRKEPRAAAAAAAASQASPTTTKADPDAYALPPGGVPHIRRASTQNDNDRPKRAIHPPKSRDIDYTALANFNKKKLPLDFQFAFHVIESVMDDKNAIFNNPFLLPVDPVALGIPNYWSIIKNPMDLTSIKTKLVNGEYQTLKQIQTDFQLIVKNCSKFNGPDHIVTAQALQMESFFKDLWGQKAQWIEKNTPSKVVDDGSSSEGEEESEDDEGAAGSQSAKQAAISNTIVQLEQRLADEAGKLSQLLMNIEESDETMIDVQRTVVNTIRSRLIKEKEQLGASKPEKPAKGKAAKSGGKAAKSSGGGGGGRKSGGGAAAKKSGGGGGGGAKRAKRQMSQSEKDAIANGINDLDEGNISKAIDIIKKDTGQSENDSGELELEIDQLTNEALHKLWDLLKRVLPNFGTAAPSAPDSPPVNHGASSKQAAKSGKPKKNKPMNAREQEARIAELERLKNAYKTGQGPVDEREPEMPVHPHPDDTSDSEEE